MGTAACWKEDMHGEQAGIGPLASTPSRASRAGGCFLHSVSRRFRARGGTASGGESGQRPHSEQSKFVTTQSASIPQRKSSDSACESTGHSARTRTEASRETSQGRRGDPTRFFLSEANIRSALPTAVLRPRRHGIAEHFHFRGRLAKRKRRGAGAQRDHHGSLDLVQADHALLAVVALPRAHDNLG